MDWLGLGTASDKPAFPTDSFDAQFEREFTYTNESGVTECRASCGFEGGREGRQRAPSKPRKSARAWAR